MKKLFLLFALVATTSFGQAYLAGGGLLEASADERYCMLVGCTMTSGSSLNWGTGIGLSRLDEFSSASGSIALKVNDGSSGYGNIEAQAMYLVAPMNIGYNALRAINDDGTAAAAFTNAGAGYALFGQSQFGTTAFFQSQSNTNTNPTVVVQDNDAPANTKLFAVQNTAGTNVATFDKEGDLVVNSCVGCFTGGTVTSSLSLDSDDSVLWRNATSGGSADTGLARHAASTLKVTDGSTGYGELRSSGLLAMNGADAIGLLSVNYGGLGLASTQALKFGTTSNALANTWDAILRRGGAGILSQSNTTNAQEQRLYATTDSDTAPVNYERLVTKYSAGDSQFQIIAEKGGTGVQRPLVIKTAAASTLQFSNTTFTVNLSANGLGPSAANTMDLGTVAAPLRTAHVGTGVHYAPVTAPAAPASGAVVYLDTADSDLKIKWADGTTITIADKP